MKQLWGACKKGLENDLCLGCNKLELDSFTGQAECEYLKEPRQKIKEILGIQERIKL